MKSRKQQEHSLPPPNFTAMPNDILDTWLPKLQRVEFKVFMCIVRQIYGYPRKEAPYISLQELPQKTGATPKQVQAAVQSLIQQGAIAEGDVCND